MQTLSIQTRPKMYGFTKPQILDSSKLKEFADSNFKFDENCRKFSKWVVNTIGKGESASSPFPTVFSKDLYSRLVKQGLFWKRVKKKI